MLKRIFYPRHIEHSLKYVKELQTKYPTLIVGGSVALYLYGVNLKRFKNWQGDLDFIMDKYTEIDIEKSEELPSNCDFHKQGSYAGKKVDVRFDPVVKFEEILYRGSIYKVGPLEDILEAKCRYKREKDKQDIREMLKIN
jgi:hypothetical protein